MPRCALQTSNEVRASTGGSKVVEKVRDNPYPHKAVTRVANFVLASDDVQ